MNQTCGGQDEDKQDRKIAVVVYGVYSQLRLSGCPYLDFV